MHGRVIKNTQSLTGVMLINKQHSEVHSNGIT